METTQKENRQDLRTLQWGVVISLIFTAIIWWAGQFLDTSNFLPDQGASWVLLEITRTNLLDALHRLGFLSRTPDRILGCDLSGAKEQDQIQQQK